MKAGIAGGGAMGCMFAAYFHKKSIDTLMVEIDPATVAALKGGLTVIEDGHESTVPVSVTDDPGRLSDRDLLLLFVKTYATGPAMAALSPHLKPGCIVVTLQNGIGNYEIISRHVPENRIVYGSTTIGASKPDRATVKAGGTGTIVLGGADAACVEAARRLLAATGADVSVTNDPGTAVWKKAIINAGINPLGAILDIPNGMLLEREHAMRIQEAVIHESVAVARAKGMKMDEREVLEATREVCRKTSVNICSMLQDIRSGRRTEIDSINGYIADAGRELGIPTPWNDALTALVKAKEAR